MLYKHFHNRTNIGNSTQYDVPTQPGSKAYPRFEAITLPESARIATSLSDVLERRNSSEAFGSATVFATKALATLLFHSVGVREDGKRMRPSGGASYPLECYVVANRIENVASGIYHYNTKHTLERLIGEEGMQNFMDLLVYDFTKDAACYLIFTAVWGRAYDRYRDVCYRIAWAEAGHAMQNALLAATALKVNARPLIGFFNDKLDVLLDIDKDDENALYVLALSV